MQKTTNYNLNKPEGADFYDVEDFNANADIIDTKLKELEDAKGTVAIDDTTIVRDTSDKLSVKDYDKLAKKPTLETATLTVANWVGADVPYTYDLGLDATIDAEILLPNTATADEVDACVNAQITGNGTDNLLRAWGDKPTIDIPIVIRKVVK